MTEAAGTETSASGRKSGGFARLRLHLWWIAATVLLLLALYIVLARQLMSMAPDFRVPLQDLLSERFDTPVTIGALHGHMDGMSPVFVFDDVALSPGEDDAAAPLVLERVELSISPWASLMARSVRLRQLWISGVELHLVRSEDGDMRFRGLEAFRGDQVDSMEDLRGVLEQVYLQRRIVLDDVRARIDWPGMPPLRTEDLSIALVREGKAHQLAVRLSAIDRPFELDMRLHLRSDVYALSDIDGSAYLRLRGEDLQYWLPEQWPLPLQPVSANGQVEVWGALRRGEVESADVLLATRDVMLRHREAGESWALDSLNASLAVRRETDGYVLLLDEVRARTENAGALRAGPLALRWDGQRTSDTRWAMRAEQINATRLREQLEAWPFPLPDNLRALRQRLVALAPSGELVSLYVAGQGTRIGEFSSRFRDLAVAADEGQPGVRGVSGWLAGSPDSGVVNLVSPALVLDMGAFFEEPMAASIGGALRWQREIPSAARTDADQNDADQNDADPAPIETAPSLVIQSGLLRASNADASAQAMLELALTAQQVPHLRLLGELTQGEASRASSYVPLARMASPLRDWFAQAFTGGTVERGRFLYEGPVKIDPARQQDRTFQMSFAVSDFDLRFLPDWPQVEQIEGTVLVDGVTVHARDLSARYLGTRVSGADVDVVGTAPGGQPRLLLDGAVAGPASALQTLLRGTPVSAVLPAEVADWEIRGGELAGDLSLRIPLSDQGPPLQVEAEATVRGVGLHSAARRLSATDLTGTGGFSLANGLTFSTLTGQLFDAPVTASVSSDGAYTTVNATGNVPVPALQDWLQIRALAPLDGRMAYRASLRLPRREGGDAPRLQVTSDMEGVSVALPPPLGKAAADSLPMQLTLDTGDTNLLTLSLASLGSARLEYGDEGLQRGAVRLGERIAGLPPSGLLIDGHTPVLDLAAWLGVLLGQDTDGAAPLPPLRLALDTDQLLLLSEPVGPASFSARQNDTGWELALFSDALVGEVRVPSGYTLRGERPMEVDIERLRWPLASSEASADGEAAAEGSTAERVVEVAVELAGDGAGEFVSGLVLQPDPANMPVADLRLANITLHGRHFGQWQAQLRPRANGFTASGVRGRWRETSVTGDLDWDEDDNGVQHTRFAGSFDSGQSADLLSLFDLTSFLESRDASGTLDIGWQGSPLEFDYRQLQGTVSLNVRDALLPSADRRTSALRLLGLVNVGNTLSRRLRLDFSDVVSQGLLTDSIRGTFTLDGSQIDTDNLRIRSPSAEFLIAGGLNLADQTMDYDIEVTLPLSSNLYAGCLAGPAACAGIFVVERLWGDRLEKMTSMDYRVSGDWDDARVEERGP
ncbi:hypothetical protein K8B33_10895 [Alcanivorax sp. JB21]|uniref:YhdP family phospholipid transporter n=1 Tax=Alcanivorax limicola TaxID=2874102 RepID=UPI001CBDF3FB|nr:AsmA-like C-terminal region-containing protein [Alcanivorax limicola]MBZ2189606.1 hypothetical protein [Alcanivorax limicola]